MPMTPLPRKSPMEVLTARSAVLSRSRPMRVESSAMATVAKTSKKPSTQRWTTHQRQYSARATWVSRVYMKPAE